MRVSQESFFSNSVKIQAILDVNSASQFHDFDEMISDKTLKCRSVQQNDPNAKESYDKKIHKLTK